MGTVPPPTYTHRGAFRLFLVGAAAVEEGSKLSVGARTRRAEGFCLFSLGSVTRSRFPLISAEPRTSFRLASRAACWRGSSPFPLLIPASCPPLKKAGGKLAPYFCFPGRRRKKKKRKARSGRESEMRASDPLGGFCSDFVRLSGSFV